MGVLDDLKTTLSMGARPNKYKIMISAPVGPNDDVVIDTLCKGGSIPAKTMGIVEVWTQGRKLVVAGDATFENTWTLTFWSTEDHDLRNKFDDWLMFIDDMEKHQRGATSHTSYMSEGATVQQLSTVDNKTATANYKFHNLWPTSISSIELADETIDTISEFTVDFAYSHWEKA